MPILDFFINLNDVHTNIVYFKLDSVIGSEFVKKMAERGILFFEIGEAKFRLVTHYGITSEDIETVLKSFNEELS